MAINRSSKEVPVPLGTPIIYSQQDLEEIERHYFAGGEAAAFTHSAPNKASGNEDTAAVVPLDAHTGVLIVADGVGGSPKGSQASTLAVHTILTALGRRTEAQTLRDVILDGIEAANQTILDLGTGAATTLAVIEIQDNTMRPYHVGDCLMLLTGQRGKVKFQNIPHSPTGYAVEAGLMDESDAIHHEERSMVSNVVGDTDMRIEIGPSTKIAAKDTLVIASDGLADNLYAEEIIETVRTGDLMKSANRLISASRDRMHNPNGKPSHPDDLTFILFRRNTQKTDAR